MAMTIAADRVATAAVTVTFQRATVFAGAASTDYRVAGCGQTVLLLGDVDDPFERALIDALHRDARLIVPELTNGFLSGRAFSEWLRDFLDGLGLGEVAVVAGAEFALPMLGFTLLDGTRVSRLVLWSLDATDPAAPACVIREQLSCTARPLLLVRSDATAADELVNEVVQFLSGAAR